MLSVANWFEPQEVVLKGIWKGQMISLPCSSQCQAVDPERAAFLLVLYNAGELYREMV